MNKAKFKYKLDGQPIGEEELIRWAEGYCGKDVSKVEDAIHIMIKYGHQVWNQPINNN